MKNESSTSTKIPTTETRRDKERPRQGEAEKRPNDSGTGNRKGRNGVGME